MITNAQFGVDDFSTPEFLKACKEMRERDKTKQEKLLKEYEELKSKIQNGTTEQAGAQDETVLGNNGSAIDVFGQESTSKSFPNGEIPHNRAGVTALMEVDSVKENNDESLSRTERENGKEIEQHKEEERASTEKVEQLQVDMNEEGKENSQEELKEEESESEAEESIEIDHSKELVLDKDLFDKLKKQVVKLTDQFTIDKLEMVMARLMDIVWTDRNEWDKTPTLQNIEKVLTSLQPTS